MRFKPLFTIVVVVYFIIHIFSLTLQDKRGLSRIERGVVKIAAPLQYVVNSSVEWVGNIFRNYFLLVEASKENRRLKIANAQLRTDLIRLQEAKVENERLRAILDLEKTTKLQLVAAERIAHSITPYEKTVRVKRGNNDGIQPGMAVIHPQGVVGQVFQSHSRWSDVLLLVDKASAIDVIAQKSRARGLLRGDRLGSLQFQYLLKDSPVEIGEEIVTSGLDGVYPPGLPVGTLRTVESDPKELFLQATVEPAVDFKRLEEVAIVLGGG